MNRIQTGIWFASRNLKLGWYRTQVQVMKWYGITKKDYDRELRVFGDEDGCK